MMKIVSVIITFVFASVLATHAGQTVHIDDPMEAISPTSAWGTPSSTTNAWPDHLPRPRRSARPGWAWDWIRCFRTRS